MPHRDTSVDFYQQAITKALNATQEQMRSSFYQTSYYSGSKCHTGAQAYLSIKQAIAQTLNATQGHKPSFLSNNLLLRL